MSLFLTNDDGVNAPGLLALEEALHGLDELLVVAPLTNRSGIGHAITLDRPIKLKQWEDGRYGAKRLSLDGNPADAVKFAAKNLFEELPRLAVSGINNGPNIGVNTHYSGTVGAALECLIQGISSVAVSIEQHIDPDFGAGIVYARRVVEYALALEDKRRASVTPGPPFCLNLNLPALPPERIKGIRLTTNGTSGFDEYFYQDQRHAPDEYAIAGQMRVREHELGSDALALREGYASLTPLRLEMTDDALLERLRRDGFEEECS